MKHVTTPTGEPLDSLPPELAMQERQRQKALKRLRKLRTRAADEIDRLLAFLDASDIDPDLEPWLGWTAAGARSYGNEQGIDDLEEEPEHEESTYDDERGGDDEPSLGSLENFGHGDQTRWAEGGRRDLELDGAESGIGDQDGLMEQIGSQDWQQGRMG